MRAYDAINYAVQYWGTTLRQFSYMVCIHECRPGIDHGLLAMAKTWPSPNNNINFNHIIIQHFVLFPPLKLKVWKILFHGWYYLNKTVL